MPTYDSTEKAGCDGTAEAPRSVGSIRVGRAPRDKGDKEDTPNELLRSLMEQCKVRPNGGGIQTHAGRQLQGPTRLRVLGKCGAGGRGKQASSSDSQHRGRGREAAATTSFTAERMTHTPLT